ncbi:MAG: hypothetical protein R3F43_02715 [bacterium]
MHELDVLFHAVAGLGGGGGGGAPLDRAGPLGRRVSAGGLAARQARGGALRRP